MNEEGYVDGTPALPSGNGESEDYNQVTTGMIEEMQKSSTSYDMDYHDDGSVTVTAVSSSSSGGISEVDNLLDDKPDSDSKDGLPELERID